MWYITKSMSEMSMGRATRTCFFGRRRSRKVYKVTLADGPLHGFPYSDMATGWRNIRRTRSRNSSNGQKRQSSKGSWKQAEISWAVALSSLHSSLLTSKDKFPRSCDFWVIMMSHTYSQSIFNRRWHCGLSLNQKVISKSIKLLLFRKILLF